MKKSFLIVLLFLIAASYVFALTLNVAETNRFSPNRDSQAGAPLNEGFEGTSFPPDGWTVTTGSFERSTTNKIAGTYSARYIKNAVGAVQSGKRLRTLKVVVNASSPRLSFQARAGGSPRGEKIQVCYSATGSAPYTYIGTVVTLNNPAQTFSYTTNTISPGDYYFFIETFCSENTSATRTWIIDEVTGPSICLDSVAPQNLLIEKSPGMLTISWDAIANATGYQVCGCDSPDGTFTPIRTVANTYIEFTDAELALAGLDNRAFFQVTADIASKN